MLEMLKLGDMFNDRYERSSSYNLRKTISELQTGTELASFS